MDNGTSTQEGKHKLSSGEPWWTIGFSLSSDFLDSNISSDFSSLDNYKFNNRNL